MSAIKEYLKQQIEGTIAQPLGGLPIVSVEVDGSRLRLEIDITGPGADLPFWQAVKEAYD